MFYNILLQCVFVNYIIINIWCVISALSYRNAGICC